MSNASAAGRVLKRLSLETQEAVNGYSAGEMSRRRNWEFFVKHLPADHTLRELGLELYTAMSEEDRNLFLRQIEYIKLSRK